MDTETVNNTTGTPIVRMHYQRPGWFKTLKTVLTVFILIKLMLELGYHVWFYLDQQTALTYYRSIEAHFQEDDVQSRVLWGVVVALILNGIEIYVVNSEKFCLALLCATNRFICCIVLIRVITSDVSTQVLALVWTEMVVHLVILVLLSVFAWNLRHIQTQEEMQQYADREAREIRPANATSPTTT